jgi:hypothetical protein
LNAYNRATHLNRLVKQSESGMRIEWRPLYSLYQIWSLIEEQKGNTNHSNLPLVNSEPGSVTFNISCNHCWLLITYFIYKTG